MGKLSFRSTLLMIVAVATATHIPAADATHHSSKLRVGLTLVEGAAATGAVCLDGTLPGYYLHPGHGSGANNWVIHLEGGGWCNSTRDCVDRTKTRGGSAKHMKKQKTFSGILSNKSEENPDFFNWNRVRVSYCDGASFAGEGEDKAAGLKYRGKRIFFAVVEDLMAKGMRHSHQVLLSGCSAGGNAVILRCDDFKSLFPRTSRVKCLADAGLFLDAVDISGVHRIEKLAHDVVRLQGIQKTLPQSCTSHHDPDYCFIPQYAIRYVRTPMFILQAAYDPTQIHVSVAPNTSDPDGKWYKCKLNIKNCSPSQIDILHAFRSKMVNVVQEFGVKKQNGFYIHSCFSHCQSEDRHTWFSDSSPRINNKRIAVAVGDWYFDRASVKIIDCPYPCDRTCRHKHFNKSAY